MDIWKVMLSNLGYRVTSCTDSREALKIHMADPDAFDLVITDMNMPLLSGTELVKRMRKTKPDQVILLCTGYSDYMDTGKAAQMGIRAFALKPLTKKMFAELIRNILDSK